MKNILIATSIVFMFLINLSCKKEDIIDDKTPPPSGGDTVFYSLEKFCMGADLSYVNQIEDHQGVYRDSGEVRDPFRIFKDHGANLVRVRLWHNPEWVRDVYSNPQKPLYSGLADAEKTIKRAKDQGMAVNLDIHYSDIWADPAHQDPPAAWNDIKELSQLKEAVYQYTFETLTYLNEKGLMPEMVQIGNETNCGMMITNTVSGFPNLNVCNGQWIALGEIINEGIRAVREVSENSSIKSKVILHIAEPQHIEWWFDNIKSNGKVTDFDIVGFSYYPLWHTTVSFADLPALVTKVKNKYSKEVMIVETAYPWTTDYADNYNNSFGNQSPLPGFPFTKKGQYDFMVALTQKMITAGASGIMYWEPAWITSNMKDLWGTGSSWENATFFDFEGNTVQAIDFMNRPYVFP